MTVRPVSLIRRTVPPADLSALEPIARQLAKELSAIMARETRGPVTLTAGSASLAGFSEWRIAQSPFAALLRYRHLDGADEIIVHIPGQLVNETVDFRYGGTGRSASACEFTQTELRFLDRLGERIGTLLRSAFDPQQVAALTFAGIQSDIFSSLSIKPRELVALQPFLVENSVAKSAVISLIMSPDSAFLSTSRADSGQYASPAEQRSSGKMQAASMRIRVPVRTVLAASEMPTTKIARLAAGDILSMPISPHASLTIGGQHFASGPIGQSNGHAALLIEKLHEGTTP